MNFLKVTILFQKKIWVRAINHAMISVRYIEMQMKGTNTRGSVPMKPSTNQRNCRYLKKIGFPPFVFQLKNRIIIL